MSNLDFDLDDLGTERADDSEGIKSLRAALKAANAQIKAANTELSTFRTKERQGTLSDLLKSKGVPEAAYGLYPKDADASEEAVTEWVKTYGAAFGIQVQPTGLDPATVAAMQQVQSASATAPTPAPGDVSTLQARIAGAKNREELHAIYAEIGMRPA